MASSLPQRLNRFALQQQLEARAHEALRNPLGSAPVPEGCTTILRLWHSTSFGPMRAWALIADVRAEAGQPLRARRITWDHLAEQRRFTAPMSLLEESRFVRATTAPLLTVEDGRLPWIRWLALQARAPRMRLPMDLLPGTFATLDGERFGLEHVTFTGSVQFNLEWENEPSEEWREVATWAAQVRACLDGYVSTAAGGA